MARFRVVHRTAYEYGLPMADGFTITHLEPREAPNQHLISSSLAVEPEPDELERSVDALGNPVTRFAVHRPHTSLVVESTVEVDSRIPELPPTSPSWEDVAALAADSRDSLAEELGPYLAHTPSTERLAALEPLVRDAFTPGRGVLDAVREFCGHVFAGFRFDAGFSDVTTPLEAVLEARRGVCQDFAHVSCAALRSLGLPARYVSGYIETVPPPGAPKLVGVDASHAWCAVWAGDLGWVDFDPTNDQMPPRRHVTVGWGRDYHDVTPVRGVVIGPGGSQTLTVAVDVTALD